jgi:hypothetical protein
MQIGSGDVIGTSPKAVAMGSIASLFRCPFLERVAHGTHVPPILELADHFSQFNPPSRTTRLSEWFEFFYRLLFEKYRCEYVYKNAIATKVFLSRHSLHTSFMTDEIRSAKSRGDVAILNGTSTVYEIKSHYDSFERLDTQSVLRESPSNKHATDPGTIFDCMRQVEYCRAITEVFGYVPQVPNSQLYRHARNMFCSLSPTVAHDLMVEQVKKRGKKRSFVELIESAPVSLKHVCLSFSKSAAMASNIAARLREPLVYEKIFSFPPGQAKRIDGAARVGGRDRRA